MKKRTHRPKNIVISHVYSSDNKGDAALTSVLISDLRRVFPGCKLTILRLESVQKNGQFEGVPEKPSFMYYALNRYSNPLAKLTYTLFMMVITLVWAKWRRATGRALPMSAHLLQVAKIYERADVIVPVGGGYIRSRAGLLNRFNVPLLLHPLLFAYILGKPTVLYSQSVGPFQNRFETWLVTFVFKRMDLILLREDTSVALLGKLGVHKNVARAIDSGFLLASKYVVNIRHEYHIPNKALLLGVTVRAWLKGRAQVAYERAVAEALDNMIQTAGAHVVFIPQVTANKGDDDRIVSTRVYGFMRRQQDATLITDDPDHHRIKALYDGLDLLLGTRFHSVIFSLTSYVPVLAIEYEHKTSGIMRDLDLENWSIKIEDVTAQTLTRLLQKLVRRRAEYRRHLRSHLPPYIRRAKEAARLLARAVATNS